MTSRPEIETSLEEARAIRSGVTLLLRKIRVDTTSDQVKFGQKDISPEQIAKSKLSDPIKEFFAAVCATPNEIHSAPGMRLLGSDRSSTIWLGMISNSGDVFGLRVTGTTREVFRGGKQVEVVVMPDRRPTDPANEHRAKLDKLGIGDAYQDLVEHIESTGTFNVAEELFAFAQSVTQSPTPAAA